MNVLGNRRGALFIEYAMMLALVIAIGVFFISSNGISDSIASIFSNTSDKLELAFGKKSQIKANYGNMSNLNETDQINLSKILSALDKAVLQPIEEKGGQLAQVRFNASNSNKDFTVVAAWEYDSKSKNPKNTDYNSNVHDSITSALSDTGYNLVKGSISYDIDNNIRSNVGENKVVQEQGLATSITVRNKTTGNLTTFSYSESTGWNY